MTGFFNVLGLALALFSAVLFMGLLLHLGTIEDFITEALKKKKLENKKRELELDTMELDYKIKKKGAI